MREKRKIAIYLRLSIEDDAWEKQNFKGQEESISISNQRKLLMEYIGSNQELSEQKIAEFCDDGFSGTNMERPGMQELLKQVKQGKISCILVKDMSRFSRDYIELGTYLNQIFPFMRVRFISVNDHYDSREHEGSTTPIDTAFRTLLYDLYSKDISIKVKAAFQSKCANGEYVFGQVPFGYAKSRTEKNKVVVNEKEAKLVRYIFSLAEEGMSSTQIARRLFEERLPTAAQMRHAEKIAEKHHGTWSSTMVRRILNNRFYLGEMAYGKSVRRSVGSKVGIALPKEEWRVILNHHEPLVTPELFARVAAFGSRHSDKEKIFDLQNTKKHPLTGKLYCGGCGYSINYNPQRKGRGTGYFWCRKHALLQIPDCCTHFNAAILEEIVLMRLCQELMYQGDLTEQRESLERFQKDALQRLAKEKENCKGQYSRLQKEKDFLYEGYVSKQMGADDYREKADAITLQMRELSCKLENVEIKYSQTMQEYLKPKQDMKQVIRFSGMEELTQEIVDTFIKKITIYRDKRIELEWNYAFTRTSH